ncbi:lytic transglycosylase [Inmirania thermothiophila]|uniref:Membrane-bound lytic murein transglycosylase D n=1 Tax=Inmirania thermothiophila TaxID=1750597 RepID=A0A3N1Y1J6_9GAMM|nr:LysM peptidoglycan-binding domain-containing protein [Inmirania thermothiophila]ROR32680.1 membrane-bound lytic murein transglycosylase D [Inmirania thermothiophila]
MRRLSGLAFIAAALAGCAGLEARRDPAPTAPPVVLPAGPPSLVVAPQHPAVLAGPPEPAAAVCDDGSHAPAAARVQWDLWARLRGGLALPRLAHPRVQAELRWFGDHPDYLERVAERARPYLRLILEAVEARGMPSEIALLPVVESGFQPFAYSPGRAAGLWQFIPATGRRFGLRQDWWYDGRRDVLEATRAALDYLERLHETFDGDWLLALAAYNAGAGTVQRAVRANHRRGRPVDFFSLDLPPETAAYVPRLLAVAEAVARPDAFGLRLPEIPDEPVLEVVELDGQIDLALAAELAGIDIETLYRLNPAYNRWATPPEGPHRLLLPREAAPRLRQALAELPPERRVRWVRHRIRGGESLLTIARRYRTTVEVLRRTNGIRGNLIRAGDHLLVPVASRAPEAYVLSAEARRRRTLAREEPGRRVVHTVRRGESLWGIARRYGVSVARLARWNGIAPADPIRPGDHLVLWLPQAAPTPARAAPPARVQKVRYTVRRGDSLAAISSRFRVRVDEVVEWNGIDPDRYLQPGQELILYVDVTEQSSS